MVGNWGAAADLLRINGFGVKPRGASGADTRIPMPKDLKNGEWPKGPVRSLEPVMRRKERLRARIADARALG